MFLWVINVDVINNIVQEIAQILKSVFDLSDFFKEKYDD